MNLLTNHRRESDREFDKELICGCSGIVDYKDISNHITSNPDKVKSFLHQDQEKLIERIVEWARGEKIAACDHGDEEREKCSCEVTNKAMGDLINFLTQEQK